MRGVGTVYLVGAGCGGADLITVRGQRLLSACDAVVYDDLIDPALLRLVPPHAELVYMGKRSGRHSAPQEEISAVLIQKAREGKRVVRLKGGDPFVFGRGGEEMLALLAAGIPCQVVPGVTSAIAIPAEKGIPVTHRGRSRSLHIITAHTAGTEDGLPPDLERLAGLRGTLVFLMGLRQLPRITARLMDGGMHPETPAAVLSGGNAPYPAAVRGRLCDIAEKAREVQPPAVIVVGEVAAMNLQSPGPLSGVTVAMTGTDAVLGKMEGLLSAAGATAFCALRSAVEELPTPLSLDALARSRGWLVFTSANGVDAFFARLRREKFDVRRLHFCRFAVIGPGTGGRLGEYGVMPDLCPEVYTGEALGRALLERAEPGASVCLLRSARGGALLRRMLEERFSVEDIPLYDLRSDAWATKSVYPRLEQADYLTFSSASGVELFLETYGAIPKGVKCVCIGEVTAAALSSCDVPVLVAGEATVKSLVDTILKDHS